MTSTACPQYLKMEIQAHSALATAGRIRAADAGHLVRMSGYIMFQAFRIWRKMRALARLILKPLERTPAKKVSEESVQHSLVVLRELYQQVLTLTQCAREDRYIRFLYGPMLPSIERNNDVLVEFLDDVEMHLSSELRASLQKAITELKPPTGADWKASLEAMRH